MGLAITCGIPKWKGGWHGDLIMCITSGLTSTRGKYYHEGAPLGYTDLIGCIDPHNGTMYMFQIDQMWVALSSSPTSHTF